VIRLLPLSELIDAVESVLDQEDRSSHIWPILNEIERRDPQFEI
jgi:hypothetical protein